MISDVMKARGHNDLCTFVDNWSPSCNCDGTLLDGEVERARRAQITNALLELGWEASGGVANWPWPSFTYRFGENHIAMLGKVSGGWQFIWARSMNTILEQGSFGTPTFALKALWNEVAKLWERHHDLALRTAGR